MAQTCVVHLIRNAMRFVAYGQREAVAAALKPIYQAPTADAALAALEGFKVSELGRANPRSAQVFEDASERFKTGNRHARRLFVEAARHHRPRYHVGAVMQERRR